MNRKFKRFLQVITCCILLLLTNCQNDDFNSQKTKNEAENKRVVKLNDLPFLEKDINKRQGIYSRSASDYINMINPNQVIEYTNPDNSKTYTFALNIHENDTLTNLFITERGNDFEYHLIKYSSSEIEGWKDQIVDGVKPNININISIERLYNTSSKSGGSCFETGWVCPSGQHHEGQESECTFDTNEWGFTTYLVPCDDGGGSGSGGTGGSGGGSGTTSPNIVVNHPLELKKLTDNKPDGTKTNIKLKIEELKTKCVNPNQINEDGAQYIKSGTSYIERPPNFTGPDETRFDPDFVPGVEVVVHMHQFQTYLVSSNSAPELVNIVPFFSEGDIAAFLGLADYTNFTNNNITAILVSPAGTFALRMGSKTKMQEALTLLEPEGHNDNNEPIPSQDMNQIREKYQKEIVEQCDDTDNSCFRNNFITFINTFTLSTGQTLGILLFEAVYDSNGNITNWTQL